MARRDFFKKAQQNRYKSRNYRNPHILDSRRVNWKVLLTGTLITASCVGFISFLFAHPWFRIEQTEILGTEYIDRIDLEQSVKAYIDEAPYFVFRRSNRFLFSSEDLSDILLRDFALASVSVGLSEGQLYVHLEERTSNLLWRTQNKLFVVDLEGVVVREVVDEEDEIFLQSNISELPIFTDENDVSVTIGANVLKKEEVDQAFFFFKKLNEAGIEYSYTAVDRVAGKWVKVVTKDGYSILIDLTGDIESQYGNLAIILTDQIGDTSSLEYIDLRFGDKVYYK